MTQQLQSIIDLAWEARAQISSVSAPEVREAVEHVIADLNAGRLRVAERQGAGRVRLALVAGVEECLEAARRIVACVNSL